MSKGRFRHRQRCRPKDSVNKAGIVLSNIGGLVAINPGSALYVLKICNLNNLPLLKKLMSEITQSLQGCVLARKEEDGGSKSVML